MGKKRKEEERGKIAGWEKNEGGKNTRQNQKKKENKTKRGLVTKEKHTK
jgi:hypothetical protein